MSKTVGYINKNLRKQSKKYTNGMLENSRQFKTGKKECKSDKDQFTMLTRDIQRINDKKLNKRQESLMINLPIFFGFYIMLFYLLIKTLF